jgi:hypothetical protein
MGSWKKPKMPATGLPKTTKKSQDPFRMTKNEKRSYKSFSWILTAKLLKKR